MHLNPMLIGGVAGGLAVFLLGMLMPRPKCPTCGEQMPRFRKPANSRQAMWGGWTCAKCGLELDRKGKPVPPAGGA